MSKNIKNIACFVAAALISTPILMKKAHNKTLEICSVNNNMDIKTSLVNINSGDIVYVKYRFKNAGVLHNDISEHGISLLISRLLFNKIGGLSAEETSERLLDLEVRCFTVAADEDDFVFSFFVTKSKILDAMNFISLAFSAPGFSHADLEQVKRLYPVVLDPEMASPGDLLLDKMLSMLYADSVYGLSTTGSSQAISCVTLKSLQEFMANRFTRSNLEVIFVGKISQFDTAGYLEAWGKWMPAADPMAKVAAPTLSPSMSGESVALITKSEMRAVAGVMTAIRLDDMTEQEEAAAHVIMSTVFDDKIGDFINGLRADGITHNVFYHYLDRSWSKVFYWIAYIAKDDLQKYLAYTTRKIQEYFVKIDPGALEETREFFVKTADNGFESLNDLDIKIKKASLPFDEIPRNLLQKVAKKLFDPSRIRTVIVSDLNRLLSKHALFR
ncbi:MAG: hypothetical protein LBJ16_01535 [Holosporaceae bacterium]|jgi:predicted Zn-dependent peptidase|nr:hypothetical protein [Holosporaceae bacterium]